MVLTSVFFILMAKFGTHRDEVTFQRLEVQLLALLLVYRVTSTCYCRGAIILNQNSTSDSSLINLDEIPASPDADDDLSSIQTSLLSAVAAAEATESADTAESLYIVRNNLGDTFFDTDNTWLSCSMEKCRRKSSGTASVAVDLHTIGDGRKSFFDRFTPNDKLCHCRCHQNTPTFREDLHVCVNDIHECLLVSFVSGGLQQKIPYVLLPLRGQIIYPTAEIKFHGIHTVPTCVVSRVRYLSQSGWADIKNYSLEHSFENPMPFRLFHDKQRTFLQWLGNNELRMAMEGRLLLIDLICKDAISQLIFTPCISFRIAGAPSSNNLFFDHAADHNASFEKDKKFSAHEYIALGFATLVIALIYIASVFLYLHFKKSKLKEKSVRRNKAFTQFTDMDDNSSHLFGDSSGSSGPSSKQLVVEQEGLVKNNPLLLKRYHSPPISSSHQSLITSPENGRKFTSDHVEIHKPVGMRPYPVQDHSQMTNVLTHNPQPMDTSEPRWSGFRNIVSRILDPTGAVDSNTHDQTSVSAKCIGNDSSNREEKHPDEDISIVECPEDVPTNSKHKLYFNPAYLEPELLMTPPPAAVEFLHKIREIVSLARRKISSKKFLPSLTEIPEETRSHESTSTGRRSASRQPTPNPPYLVKEDKEKRQIIQKWLQTIPSADTHRSSTIVTEKLRTFVAEPSPSPSPAPIKDESVTAAADAASNNAFTVAQTTEQKCHVSGYTPIKPKRNSLKSFNEDVTSSRASSQPPPTDMSCDSLERQLTAALGNRRLPAAASSETLRRTGTMNANSNLPLDEELTMQNAVFNIVTGSTTMSKLKMRYENGPTARYEKSEETAEEKKYSLVSEVYVNDNFSSSSGGEDDDDDDDDESCASQSDHEIETVKKSSIAKPSTAAPAHPTATAKTFQESSRLMIQLNDCPFFYSIESAEDFEPDTLDRPAGKENESQTAQTQRDRHNHYIDSLERPPICLRSHGSFRDNLYPSQPRPTNLKRSFSSLQEIYQQRRKSIWANDQIGCDAPQSLTPQIESLIWKRERQLPRHYYRQRKQSSPPPIPFPDSTLARPPPPSLPDRNCGVETTERLRGNLRSLVAPNCRTNKINDKDGSNNCNNINNYSHLFGNRAFRFSFTKGWSYRPEDSGYLSSSDSEKSQARSQSNTLENRNATHLVNRSVTNKDDNDNNNDDDDDDESSCGSNDGGNSESGAESTATNFKFYKNRVKLLSDFHASVESGHKSQSMTSSC